MLTSSVTVSVLEEGRVASLHFMIHKVSCKEGRQEAARLPKKEKRWQVSLMRHLDEFLVVDHVWTVLDHPLLLLLVLALPLAIHLSYIR